MHPRCHNFVESLETKFQQLITMQPVEYHELRRNLPKSGLYLFSECDNHLYVGPNVLSPFPSPRGERVGVRGY
jgi:hypothetical protein